MPRVNTEKNKPVPLSQTVLVFHLSTNSVDFDLYMIFQYRSLIPSCRKSQITVLIFSILNEGKKTPYAPFIS